MAVTVLLVVFAASLLTQLVPSGGPAWLTRHRVAFRAVWPQGWGLFAGAPSSDTTVAYRVDEQGRPAMVTHPQASAEALWGLRRDGYALFYEIAQITARVPGDAWANCPDGDPDCRAAMAARSGYPLASPLADPLLCGRIALVSRRPVAFGASAPQSPPMRAVAVLVLQISCSPGAGS